VATFLVVAQVVHADFKADVGYNTLSNELAATLPTGSGISVCQVEAVSSTLYTNYMPDVTVAEFTNKTFRNVSQASDVVSSHATAVGQQYYGRATSLSPDVDSIDNYEANDWLNNVLYNGSLSPGHETNWVQNHSWVGNAGIPTNLMRRYDYMIQEDDFLAVVGLNNGTNNPVPQLMPSCYNAISVGRSDGAHSSGTTSMDVPGRVKPEIVAPRNAVSWATPAVGSAAAMLFEKAAGTAGLGNAEKSVVMKAILMAGATKAEFPSWDRTHERPLDDHFGAGELNVYNSYHVLVSGEQTAGTSTNVERIGWDYASLAGHTTNWYFFEVPTNEAMTHCSVILTWNREITDSNPGAGFTPEAIVADMNLYLYGSSNFTVGSLLDYSTSMVDNVEHIFQTVVTNGQYALKVTTDTNVDYAIAWYTRTAQVPSIDEGLWVEGQGYQVSVGVSTGFPYGLEAATNLLEASPWTCLATNASLSNVWVFIDTESSNLVRRYYRVIADP
jgi:hypothetical protein